MQVLRVCVCVCVTKRRGYPSRSVCDQREDERHFPVLRWGKGVLACGPICAWEQELWLSARASLDQLFLGTGAELQVPLHRSS